MIVLKTNPVGMDITIQRFQEYLYAEIAKAFTGIVHNSYGRCYRNRKGGLYVAEIYSENGEYIDPYWNDTVDMVSFFGISDVADKIHQKMNVHLIVFCNLSTLTPNVLHRADEEVRVSFLKIVGKAMFQFHYDGLVLSIDKILKEYQGSIAALSSIDMGSTHAFRLNFTVNYNPKQSLNLN